VQALGWTNLEYSQFFATASLIGGIGGMLIGGILIDKFGKIRMLNVYFFILIMLTTVFPFLNMYWKNYWVISSFMVIYQILYVFTSIGLFACAMEFCWKKISASQFTLYMTIANLGRIVGAKLLGPLKNLLSWEYTICSFGVMLALAWIIMLLIKINIHVKKIEELEMKNA
jgi:PAT family beta-lactamase induction signal transducer AmpG